MDTETCEIARCEGFDVGIEDHGCLSMCGSFVYDGGGQGLGYVIDGEFIKRFLHVFRASRVSQVNGRYCLVTHTRSTITKLQPLLPTDGVQFDITAWADELQNKRKKGS